MQWIIAQCTGGCAEAAAEAKSVVIAAKAKVVQYEEVFARQSVKAKRPLFCMTIDRTLGSRLGLDVDLDFGDALLVVKVKKGLVLEWNLEHREEGCILEEGDCIVDVNGVSGDPDQILEACAEERILEIKVQKQDSSSFLIGGPSGGGSFGDPGACRCDGIASEPTTCSAEPTSLSGTDFSEDEPGLDDLFGRMVSRTVPGDDL